MKSRRFLYISLSVDLIVAVSKFIAAAVAGSTSMFSEGIHSVIEALSQVLLIWGIKSSKKLPDEDRPFGYGKEFYFWSFIVSMVIFIMGGCLSFYKGISSLGKEDLGGSPALSYAILSIAFVLNFISLSSALKAFNQRRGSTGFWKAVIATKDPSTIIVLLGDIGDLLGILVAALGIYLGHLFHKPFYDSLASMIIGLILIAISAVLIRESKSLLMGEPVRNKTLRRLKEITEYDPAILKVISQYTMYMAPDEVIFHSNAIFKAGLTTRQITNSIERITGIIQKEFPVIKYVYIEPVAK